ncbi:nonribosomal peptide synthase Pes1 [Aspergillus clavatus NRRL 1]|uniref:Nonribosomal peptide synthase Pes1 n=1 Tax=Aspergillus clavatus (strain ATCC 1007 / CBS 513.65 / DSM 816 / NCTC 3887 / NRRL 1 / QM 1276 / 107) TaxID=344612 RepID=A1CQ78_ASPCL|nr:nonribosomal peptide synthase Pes1 [Aspergillus clavatus NRRL 1]EAW07799.1 nonribosomal peptide synthase Pes1 [Aspergillus clavatus NRRL 1]
MAHSAPCYLPKFGATHLGLQRPLSMRLRIGASQSAGLLAAWNEGHLNSLLQAAWALLLHRYTGSEDICFGYHQIGGDGVQNALQQPLDTADPSIFKLSINEDDTPKTFLDHVKTHSYFDSDLDRSKPLITTSNADLPFNTILMIRICHDFKGTSSIPSLFPIALPEKVRNKHRTSKSPCKNGPSNSCLQCRIRMQAKVLQEEVGIFFEWWNNDMPTEQVKSIAGVFERITAELLSAQDVSLGSLDIFPENDWSRVCKFNSVFPKKHERCIHDAIYEQTLLQPDHEAVCAWDGSLSYQQLDDLSSKVAYYLQKRGVGPEVCVALCFEKSKWNIVAMVAVLKAGGAFVPMDPTHPTARLQSLVRGVQAQIMLCSRNYAEKLQTVAETLLPLDDEFVDTLPSPTTTVSSTVKSSNAAYVIFTSGSTGEPKGTLLEHGAYFSSVMAHGPAFSIDSTTRILQFAAHTFDASLVDILTGLMLGACVCIPSEEARLTDIAGVINDMRIDFACLTPSFIGFLEPSAVPGLKTLVLAGEAMSPSHLATWSHLTLVNGYGPTESSVTAALNTKLSATSDCRDIGQQIGVRWWVVNPKNHDQLAPIGCPGELVLEGPTLARCYVNNPQKTNDAFIYDPAWTKRDATGGSGRRFYKTGDLVRYSSVTGSLTYIGRKDTQVKFHGQRIELGEIENQLSTDVDVKHCVALLPKSGFSQGKLVAVLSLSAGLKDGPDSDAVPLKLLENRVKAQYVKDIRERLSARLPTYMVPSVWLCVETMPMLVSGKLDRKLTSTWVSGMAQDPDMPATGPTEFRSINATEDQLASIWSRVLNISKDRISLKESFLSLGGDSIAAITCVGQCKKQGIGLTVQEILRSKSIRDLATRVKEVQQPAAYHEKIEEPFDLSPIQKLHFMVREEGQGYFNQSVLTRIDRRINDGELRRAVDAVVMRHSMLRSRLVGPGTGSPLQQRITEDAAGSYRWRMHTTASQATVEKAVAESQLCINAFVGPMFSVDFFYANNNTHNFLSLVGHHLVVDIVSWRIILEDLEDYLNDPQAFALQNSSLPFQTWCHLQDEQCRSLLSENELQVEDLPAPDLAYWGMEARPMTYGDVVCETFDVDADSTQSILLECHESLRTEPVEVFLAALLHTFGQTFSDRALPVIYNEGHGREVWDSSIDISRTVGWFTTLYPIFVSDIVSNDPARTVARVKDLRRQVSDNGRQKFASRMFTGQGQEHCRHHCPLEMTFNYVGQHRDLQKQDGLFQLTGHMAGETGRGGGAADFGEETPRFALLEISALVVQGRLRFTFSFNRFMHRQEGIRDWISRCQQLLSSLGQQLQSSAPKPTLSDFPMLSLTYDELDKMVLEKLPRMDISSLDLVEDIYPCSRMQQGILISQSRDTSFYAVHDTFEVRGFRTKPDIGLLRLAWQKVVSHHSILRTVFVQNLTSRDLFSQVVLKEFESFPNLLTCSGDSDVLPTFESQQPMDYRQHCPAHRLTLCQTASGKLFCRLEISHAAMDGMSISLIVRDLQLAYSGKLQEDRKPVFQNYMKYLQTCSHNGGLEYWCDYLADIKPCHFPVLNDGKLSTKQLHTIRLNFASLRELQTLCESGGVTLSTAFSTAWGLTLRSFCSSDDVCFSYMASLRDVAVEEIDAMIGPIINLLACRMKITETASLRDVLDQVQNDYMESLPYRHTSLIDIQHALKLSDTILFNSGVSYRKLPSQSLINTDDIRLVEVGSIHDPAEFPVYVNIETTDDDAQIDLHYWTDALSDGQAQNVASTFLKSLENIIHCQDEEVRRLDALSEQNKQQIAIWNKHIPKTVDRCVHEILEETASSYPEATALSALDGSLTYSKLNELSALLAFYLTKLGVGPGVLVPMEFERSSWQIIAMLAVLRLGGICLPLTGIQSDEIIEKLLVDHDVQVALASPHKAQILEGTISYVVPVSKSLFDYLPRSGETLTSSVKPTDGAYVVFTTGSVQGSKPVVLDHQTILTRAEAFASALGLNETTKMLQFAPCTSDMFLQEVLSSLMCGGRVCIPADHSARNLSTSINTSHANTVSITPSLASLIRPSDVPEVQVLALHGERMTTQAKDLWSPKVRLHLWYGAAECSSTSIHTSDSPDETRNLGRSAGCTSWLVDPADHNLLVPIGCVGELVLEGPVLASGYLLEGEHSSENFIEEPVWSLDSEHDGTIAETGAEIEHAPPIRRMFKTGDLARYESDGSLVYMGRKGTGARIDNWQVQKHLDSFLLPEYPSVLELIRSDDEAEAELLAVYIQFKTASSTNVDGQESSIGQSSPEFHQLIAKLHTHLLSVLSAAQVPNLYIPVPSMPLTSFGKLDRQLLRRETENLPNSIRAEFDLKSFHEFWRAELAKPQATAQLFPPAMSTSQGVSATASLRKDAQISGKLNGVDLESAILTAWALTISGYTQSDDVVFGELLLEPELSTLDSAEKTPATIVPRRFQLDATSTIAELLGRTQEKRVAALPYQKAGLQGIKNVSADTSRACGFNNLLSFAAIQNDKSNPLGLEYPLAIFCSIGQSELQLNAQYNEQVLSAPQVERILAQFTSYIEYLNAGHGLQEVIGEMALLQSQASCLSSPETVYWKEYLADAEPCHFPSLSAAKGEKRVETAQLTITDVARLFAFCEMVGVTADALLQIVWALVLRCFTGSEEVCFGYYAEASQTEDSNSAQVFPSRFLLKDASELREIAEDRENDLDQAIVHPLSEDEVQHELGLDVNSLFNTVFKFDKVQGLANADDSLFSKPHIVEKSNWILGINAKLSDARAEIVFEYSTNVLSKANIESLVDSFKHILLDIVDHQQIDRTIGAIDFFSEHACQQVQAWNATLPERPDMCAHEIIEQHVLSRPTSPAICSWDGDFTYEELDSLSTRLAQHLAGLGVRPEVFVALCFEKSAWAVIAQVAVMKAGGAFASVDPTHPEARLQGLVEDLGASIVLCSAKYVDKASKIAQSAFVVSEETMTRLLESPSRTCVTRPDIHNPAYAIFTSGTTGKPKVTVIEHICLSVSSPAFTRTLGMTLDTRALQFSSYTFDVSIMEIILVLMTGGCVCVPSEEERMNDLAGAIKRLNANFISCTPSMANTLDPADVPQLRTIVTGGEKMTPSHLERWSDRCVINAYGPSESTVMATMSMKVDSAGVRLDDDCNSIGTAVCGRTWVVDPQNYHRLLPIGAVGELVLEGSNVGRGYLNNEQKTKEVFISEPAWAKSPGLRELFQQKERMYRTGDLVRYKPDGSICFISRKDTQIKFNGQRIELEEIEQQCIACLPEGARVAVDVVDPETKAVAKSLSAFYSVGDIGNRSTVDDTEMLVPMSESTREFAKKFQEALTKVLPPSMMPKLFFPIRRLPYSTSGKLDRKKLRAAVETLPKEQLKPYVSLSAGSRQVSDEGIEGILRGLWEEALGLASGSVSAEDSFFSLGGDSFSAMKLVGAANSRGISLTFAGIYEDPIFMDMAKRCDTLREKPNKETVPPFSLLPASTDRHQLLEEVAEQCCVPRETITDVYPCSPVQEGLLTLSVKQNGAYVAQPVFRLSERVDLDKFKAAWQRVVDEMDILRTRVVHTESLNFLQAVLDKEEIAWTTAASLDELMADSPDLPKHNGGALTDYAIAGSQTSPARYFVWTIHHALYDGWSIPLVLKRLEEVYSNSSAGSKTLPYGLFIEYLLERNMSDSDEYWKSQLANLSCTPFPQSKNSLPDAVRVGNRHQSSMKISRAPGGVDLTVPELIRAAWAVVVAAHTGSSDVCFGETLMGRNIDLPGVTDIAGPVLTTIPTRIQVENELPITQYLESVHHLTTTMLPHQHSGLQRIRKLNSDTASACEFQNLLVIQTGEGQLNENLWMAEPNQTSGDFFTHPLVVECKVGDSEVTVTMHHDEMVLNSWQTEKLIGQFSFVLEQLLSIGKAETRKLNELEIFSPVDRNEVAKWNQRHPEAVEQCAHDIIFERCSAHPDSPAICAWDGEVSYREMYDLASSFATYLVSRGIGPETLVPICLDKSLWAVITILSIFIAGGAYVPLDPAHPTSRHEEILAEVDARVVLCSPQYHNRYSGIVKTIIPVSKETVKAYSALSGNAKRSNHVTPSNMAYAIFTSGSTGRAKGIIIDHRALASSVMAFGPLVGLTETSRAFQFASLTFDAAVMEVLATLMHGGCICIPSEDERLNDVAGAIRRMNVTWTFLTPSIASIIEPSSVPSLEVLVCGGEKLSREVVTKWAHRVRLINGYGPTETTIFAVLNTEVSSNRDASCIGFGIPCTLTWIVDPDNHDRLAPLGAIGELALEGPALAREYLKNPQKTAEAFVDEPAWIKNFQSSLPSPRRIYKTGDLVRYNPDGSVEYISRKDHQVKLHGQRMELGEIEHRLYEDDHVRHAVVILPKAGPLQQRLVTVLSLNSLNSNASIITDNTCELISPEDLAKTAYSELIAIQKNLEAQLPIYMVPQTWALIKKLPMLVSGKLDRKKITYWVEHIDDATYERIMQDYDNIKRGNVEESVKDDKETSVSILRDIYAQVLNISANKVDPNRSFVSLGGDSITGMAVISRARKQGINLTLHKILQSKSIGELTRGIETKTSAVQLEEKSGENFPLSPIQGLYFQAARTFKETGRFNQSMTVRITRKVEPKIIRNALKAILTQHSMFRAKFSRSASGKWQQRITSNIDASYRFGVHSVSNPREMLTKIGETQSSLDIQNGPIFAADLFEVATGEQVLFLVANHLCVDMVSWRIVLQDMQEFIESGSLPSEKPLSFQAWCDLQFQKSKSEADVVQPPFAIEPSNIGYWGMDSLPNLYGQIKMESFVLDEKTTSFILGGCHETLRTETIDILLAAVVQSFRRVFTDRNMPTIYNEGHGRESWDSSIDLSRTVGWFTTMCPLQVDECSDFIETAKRMKDVRRKMVDNGRSFFAHSLLHSSKANSTNFPAPLEIVFNYLGRLQQLERDDSLFQHYGQAFDEETFNIAGDMGPDTPRFALLEISALIIKDKLQVSFTYNRQMQREKQIRSWISECRNVLERDVLRFKDAVPEPTLSDFPLLPITYDGLRRFMGSTLPRAGIDSWYTVEDIYPCSSVQEGILLSQLRDPNAYMFHVVFEVCHPNKGRQVNPASLKSAWSAVISRHPILRTRFIDSNHAGGSFDQLVLRKVDDEAIMVESNDSNALGRLDAIKLSDVNAGQRSKSLHQLTICQTQSGRVLVKIEMNHAIIDGGSVDLILRDLAMAYNDQLPEGSGPLFSDYIKFIRGKSQDQALYHWRQYLSNARPCHLTFPAGAAGERQLGSVMVQFNRYAELQQFCEKNSVTLANLTLSAWAIVLQAITGSDDVCFGYPSAGRDAPVPGIQDAVGIFLNMLCCRVRFSRGQTLLDLSKTVQSDYIKKLPYQDCSLASIQHELAQKERMLFNTTISIQNHHAASKDSGSDMLSYNVQKAHDPTEYPVTVNVETAKGHEGILLRYWTDAVPENKAQDLADAIASIFTSFVDRPSQLVSDLELLGRSTTGQFSGAGQYIDNKTLQELIDRRVTEIITQMLRDGSLTIPTPQPEKSHIQETVPYSPLEVPIQARRMPRERDMSDSTATLTEDHTRVSDLEKRLWKLWCSALHLSSETIKHRESFFKLGGDSITAMKMVSAAREDGLTLTVADVFSNPVFEDMLAIISAANSSPASEPESHTDSEIEKPAESVPIQQEQTPPPPEFSFLKAVDLNDNALQSGICPKIGVFKGGIADVLPVTDFQAMSITATLFRSRWMVNYFFLDGQGTVDLKRLRESLLRVVDAFDILRTVFVCFNGQFYQVVLRKIRPNIFVHETEKSLDEYTDYLQQQDREQEARQGEQYVQFYVLKKKDSNHHRILIRMSHAQFDGVCLPSIMSAIKLGYEGSPLPPAPSFANYMRMLSGAITPDHYQHWTNLLRGSSMTQVLRRSETNTFQHIGAFTEQRKMLEIQPSVLDNITIATVMQAAWAVTLAKLSAQPDVVFGLTISGRNTSIPGIENTVGPCLNVIPVRVKFGEKWTGLDLFRYLQDQQIANMPFEALGFREIIRRCTDWPDSTYFTTSVFHQNVEYEGQMQLDNTTYRMGGVGVVDNFTDMTLFSKSISDGKLGVSLGYSLKGPIQPKFATKVLNMVCDTVQSLVSNARVVLPSPSMLSSLPCQAVPDVPRMSDEMFLSSHLKTRSISEILVYSDVLTKAWQQVLPCKNAETPQSAFQLDSSFFDLGGDVFDVAQVVWLLEQDGLQVHLEDLLEHPTFLGQMAVLTLHNSPKNDSMEEIVPVDGLTLPMAKTGNSSSFGKALTLAKRMAKWSPLSARG